MQAACMNRHSFRLGSPISNLALKWFIGELKLIPLLRLEFILACLQKNPLELVSLSLIAGRGSAPLALHTHTAIFANYTLPAKDSL